MPNRTSIDGIEITAGYESPFKNEGVPRVSYRATTFLKEEFVSWFTQYGANRRCTLIPAEYALIKDETLEQKRQTDVVSERRKRTNRSTLLLVAIVPLALMMVSSIIIGFMQASLFGFFSATTLFLPIFLPAALFFAFRTGVLHKVLGLRDRNKNRETDVIADAMQSGRYTAYQFSIVQKKWKKRGISEEGSGYDGYHFYVEFDELTLEVSWDEYRHMYVGGVAIVVIIHTPYGDTLRVLAPRGPREAS